MGSDTSLGVSNHAIRHTVTSFRVFPLRIFDALHCNTEGYGLWADQGHTAGGDGGIWGGTGLVRG